MSVVADSASGAESGVTESGVDAGERDAYGGGPSGFVNVANLCASGTNCADIVAAFDPRACASSCATFDSGVCHVTVCPNRVLSDAGGDGCALASAGTLTLAAADGRTFAANPGTFGDYLVSGIPSLGPSGSLVSISATGAAVPAFGPVSAQLPPDLALVAPACADDAGTCTYPLDRTAPLHVAWMPIPGVKVTFAINASNATEETDLNCEFDGASGAGDVDPSLLSKFEAAGDISAAAIRHTAIAAGPYSVDFRVQSAPTQVLFSIAK